MVLHERYDMTEDTNTTDEQVTPQEAVQADVQADGGTNVTLNDLANLVQIIDVASTRGAWRGEELSGVGSIRDKIVNLLNSVQQQAEEGVDSAAE